MTCSIVDSAIDSVRWDRFVLETPAAALYHLHDWKKVVEETFGHSSFYLAAEEFGQIVGVLPLFELKSRMFGNMLVSLPYFNYGGICSNNDAVRDVLFDASVKIATERNSDFIEIRHEESWDRPLPQKTAKVAMRLELPASSEEAWKGLGSKLRSQVQRPRKEGMTLSIGREELLDGFYDVFAANMRDLGTPVYPKAFFRNILRHFRNQTWIAVVSHQGQPVATGFLAGFKERLEIPWASSLRSANRLSPNMLLYWGCLEFACRQGYRVFDFGRCTPGEGTYRFKEQWGAKPHQLYWYYWLKNGGNVPEVNPKAAKYRLAIEIWRRLPLGLTRQLGPKIIKYIP